ncbi:MAG: TlpA disulfide reductase family protein [Bacteroidota bacterium]
MTRFYIITLFVLLPTLSFSLTGNVADEGKKGIKVSGEFEGGTVDFFRLFEWDGATLVEIESVQTKQEETNLKFEFKNLEIPLGIYFIGTDQKTYKPIVLGEEKAVEIKGNLTAIPQATILNSPHNEAYFQLNQEMGNLQTTFQGLIQQRRRVGNNPLKIAELNTEFVKLDSTRLTIIEKAIAASEFIGDVISLNGYMSFQANNKGRYKDEAHYFANEFFKYADLTKENFDHIPQLLESAKTFAYTLVKAGLPTDEQKNVIDKITAQLPAGSKRHKAFLLGTTLGFQTAKADTWFVKFGDRYLAHYADQNPPIVQYLESNMNKVRHLMVGAVAPEIEQNTPEGEPQSLSSLRGSYVLVDFWASWCMPCRRENPNVVRLYNKYNNKGFEVFGVSLDRDKNSWVRAIEADSLTWHHVSDLKQWQSEAAKTYGVSGIPFTLLLDPEGKIIAKNLRGPSLEAKLEELFGE